MLRAFSYSERPRGPTDKASDYESGDSRFESWRGRCYFDSFKFAGVELLHLLLKRIEHLPNILRLP